MGRARFELPKAAVRKGAHEKVRGTKVHEARKQHEPTIEEGVTDWLAQWEEDTRDCCSSFWDEGGDEEA